MCRTRDQKHQKHKFQNGGCGFWRRERYESGEMKVVRECGQEEEKNGAWNNSNITIKKSTDSEQATQDPF